jgi:hypothetical protein
VPRSAVATAEHTDWPIFAPGGRIADMKQFMSSKKAIALLAKRSGVSEEIVIAVVQAQADLAQEKAADGFPIPGVGAFAFHEYPAREMVMLFGPNKGKVKKIPKSSEFRFYRCVAFKRALYGRLKGGKVDALLEMEFDEGEFE